MDRLRRTTWYLPFAALALLCASLGCKREVAASPAVASRSLPTTANEISASTSSTALPDGPIKLKWDELDIPLGPEQDFEPWMLSTAIKSLDGQQVQITGYMHEGVAQKSNIREFVLVKHVGCQFGAEGRPQHVIMIELQDKLRASLTPDAITLTGKFAVDPYRGPDGRVWALYRLAATSLEEGMP